MQEQQQNNTRNGPPGPFGASQEDMQAAGPELQARLLARTPFQIIGSSLIAEAVVLAFAAWIFCRRDY